MKPTKLLWRMKEWFGGIGDGRFSIDGLLQRTRVANGRGLSAAAKPKPNAVKFFNPIELITLLADPDWLDDATKTIGRYWRRRTARRRGLTTEEQADAAVVVR